MRNNHERLTEWFQRPRDSIKKAGVGGREIQIVARTIGRYETAGVPYGEVAHANHGIRQRKCRDLSQLDEPEAQHNASISPGVPLCPANEFAPKKTRNPPSRIASCLAKHDFIMPRRYSGVSKRVHLQPAQAGSQS